MNATTNYFIENLTHMYKPILDTNSADPDQTQYYVVSVWLIRIFIVCLQNFLLVFGKKKCKIPPNTPKIGHGLVLLVRVGKFICLKCVITGFPQAWKVLEHTALSWTVLENEICLEKYLKNTQSRPWKVLEFYHLQEDSTLFLET